MTFTSPLTVLDTQSSFDHTFGMDSIMIKIDYLALKFFNFCNLYRLHIFF